MFLKLSSNGLPRLGLVKRLKEWLRRIASRSGLLSALYFAFFSAAFRREQQSVLVGSLSFTDSLKDQQWNTALLRRNVHRLEKGLLMRPRREVFAVDFIGETVSLYRYATAQCTSNGSPVSDDLLWANSVLSKYFEIVGSHPRIDAAKEDFSGLPSVACDAPRTPYLRDLTQPCPVSYEDLMALSIRRRSVRWFKKIPVERQLIDDAMRVATQAPSACNRQPFVFRVLDDPSMVAKASVLPGGTGGFGSNIPVMVVVVGQQRYYPSPSDRHLIYIDGSLAAMSFVFAAETLGLGTCCINWPDIEQKESAMQRILGLEKDERPIMCIAVGYPDPDGMVAYSQKKPPCVLRRYNMENEGVLNEG